jgi:hypothetical protein
VFSGAAAPQAELRLQALLPLFQQYLGTLGLGRGVPLPEIRIETERASGLNAWVEHRTLYVGAEIADDADVAFTVYARYMVGESSPEIRDLIEGEDSQSVELTAIQWGLADYLTSSFWGRPFIGNADVAAAIPGSKLYLRSLADDVSFPEAISLDSRRTLSEAWGAALWCVRGYLGQATADRVLVDAWLRLRAEDADPARAISTELLGEIAAMDTDRRAPLLLELRRRGFPGVENAAQPGLDEGP